MDGAAVLNAYSKNRKVDAEKLGKMVQALSSHEPVERSKDLVNFYKRCVRYSSKFDDLATVTGLLQYSKQVASISGGTRTTRTHSLKTSLVLLQLSSAL